MSWLAATTVVPARAAARTAVSMALALAASTLEVGSSSSRASGRRTSRAARATRCFSPPESAFQERRSMSCSGVKPTASMAPSAACRRSMAAAAHTAAVDHIFKHRGLEQIGFLQQQSDVLPGAGRPGVP